jgi:hypothetical protein
MPLRKARKIYNAKNLFGKIQDTVSPVHLQSLATQYMLPDILRNRDDMPHIVLDHPGPAIELSGPAIAAQDNFSFPDIESFPADEMYVLKLPRDL